MTAPILIVEDEVALAVVARQYLQREGYATVMIHDGDQAMEWLRTHQPLLVVLDRMLPGTDGLTLCRELRKTSDVPIIITTARVEEIDRLLGLELGADDYLCKPYSPRELVARVKAILRRTHPQSHGTHLQLDEGSNRVRLGSHAAELTAVEMRLLQVLMQNPGRIYSRDQLMDTIYPDQRLVSDRTVDSHIKNLRKKLSLLDAQREFVRSVYGAGYKFEL